MKKNILTFEDVKNGKEINIGDIIELRDFSKYLPPDNTENVPWQTKDYYLLNGTFGRMLYVDHTLPITAETDYDTIDFTGKGMPLKIKISLPMKGKYAIWAGSPNVDIAIDNDEFTAVKLEHGGRYGRIIGKEANREYFVFYKNAELNNSELFIRIPFGTFSHVPVVEAMLSSLRFIKLDDEASLAPVDNKADKEFILVIDGFSHYFTYGILGKSFDLRYIPAYKNTDVKIFMHQIMGPLLWKSDLNSYLGEEATPEDYKGKRIGDVRNYKYVKDSIEKGYDVFNIFPEECHKHGMECHFSIRANLYFESESKYMKGSDILNGRFHAEHPEYRLPNSLKLDFGLKEVRDYHLAIYREVLEKFDVDGINLDLTRWPKCLDPLYHSNDLLIDICKELRKLADEYSIKKNKKIKVSLLLVEYYHSYCTLEEQAIDFEALMKSQTLDFVCLETNEPEKYIPIAHKYGVKFHGIIDSGSPYFNNISKDPLWALPDGNITDDPVAGSEFIKEKFEPTWPAPFEFVNMMDDFYDAGADGIAKINSPLGSLYFRDCGHSELVKKHAEEQSVFGQKAGDYLFIK